MSYYERCLKRINEASTIERKVHYDYMIDWYSYTIDDDLIIGQTYDFYFKKAPIPLTKEEKRKLLSKTEIKYNILDVDFVKENQKNKN